MYRDLSVEKKDRTAVVTIEREEVSNAFDARTYEEVRDAVTELGNDEEIRCIVITGRGRNFSAGGDIRRFRAMIESGEYISVESIRKAEEMILAVRKVPKPVIAMINGAAAGAGLSLALACDFRTGEASSRLIMAFVKLGLSGDTGSAYFLNKILGPSRAAQMMMTGEPVRGKEAYERGLLNILAADGALGEETMAFAEKLSRSATFAIARQKDLLNKKLYADLSDWMEEERESMAACSRTEDFKEAVYAFLDKREPRFRGK